MTLLGSTRSLDDLLRAREFPPAVHTGDPETAVEAERTHTSSGKRATHLALVLKAITETPGLTAAEVGERTGLGHVEAQRRLSDLKRMHHVLQGSPRLCTVKGSRMVEWLPTRRAS